MHKSYMRWAKLLRCLPRSGLCGAAALMGAVPAATPRVGTDPSQRMKLSTLRCSALHHSDHFRHHAKLVGRFRNADANSVRRMWRDQINEHGARLPQFERF